MVYKLLFDLYNIELYPNLSEGALESSFDSVSHVQSLCMQGSTGVRHSMTDLGFLKGVSSLRHGGVKVLHARISKSHAHF